MHALEVIVARNEQAAAREAAHAVNDERPGLAIQIINAQDLDSEIALRAFLGALVEG